MPSPTPAPNAGTIPQEPAPNAGCWLDDSETDPNNKGTKLSRPFPNRGTPAP